MISISCLESKLLNNNNWYGRFQLAPFQKGEGLTVANALRRTLLAEKSNFFITWVDFYNAEIPYSVLTGMRESIFDILLNLKQVIFTSDKSIPNRNHFLKSPSMNNFRAEKGKPTTFVNTGHRLKSNFLNLNKHEFNITPNNINNRGLPIIKKNKTSKNPLGAKLQTFKNKKTDASLKNIFCENQILGKMINSKDKSSPLVQLGILYKSSDLKPASVGFLKTSRHPCFQDMKTQPRSPFQKKGESFSDREKKTIFSSREENMYQAMRKYPNSKKIGDSTYIGYICAKGPTIIYAKNIKLPKGLKCVDPDKYIVTLADDGLFYLRFALNTQIKTLQLFDSSNVSININQGIRFNTAKFKTFPKILFNKEMQLCYSFQRVSSIPNKKNPSLRDQKSNQQYLVKTDNDQSSEFFHDDLTQTDTVVNGRKSVLLPLGHNTSTHVYGISSRFRPPWFFSRKTTDALFVPTVLEQTRHFLWFQGVASIPIALNTLSSLQNKKVSFPLQAEIKYRTGADKQKHSLANSKTTIVPSIPYNWKLNLLKLKSSSKGGGLREKKILQKGDLSSTKVYDSQIQQVNDTKNLTGVVKEQRLLLTNDSIKQFSFQNTSIIANIQKTCLLNVQIKHYYYKCGRFDRFLFDLIKPFKPTLKSTYYNNVYLKKKENVFFPENDSTSTVIKRSQTAHKRFEGQKYPAKADQFFINSKGSDLKKNRTYLGVSARSYLKRSIILDNRPKKDIWPDFGYSLLKWQEIFKSIKTSSIYDYFKKLSIDQTGIICLLPNKLGIKTETAIFHNVLNTDTSVFWSLYKNTTVGDFFNFIDSQVRILRLYKPYIKKFLTIGPSFECSQNNISWFLKFYILQYNNTFNFLNQNQFPRGISVKKSPTVVSQTLKQVKDFRPASAERFFPVNRFFLTKQNKLSEFLSWINENQKLKSDYHLREFCYFKRCWLTAQDVLQGDKTGCASVLSDYQNCFTALKNQNRWSSNLFQGVSNFQRLTDSIFIRGYMLSKSKRLPFKTNKDAVKADLLDSQFSSILPNLRLVNSKPESISNLLYQKSSIRNQSLTYLKIDDSYNSVQQSITLRTKPSITIQKISYKPLWIFPSQFQQNANQLRYWLDNKNFYNFAQTQTNKNPAGAVLSASCFEQNLLAVKTRDPAYESETARRLICAPPDSEVNSRQFNPITTNSVTLKPIYLNVEQIIYILKQTTKFRKNKRINPVFFDSFIHFNNTCSASPLRRKIGTMYKKNPVGAFSRPVLSNVWIFGNQFVFNNSFAIKFGMSFDSKSSILKRKDVLIDEAVCDLPLTTLSEPRRGGSFLIRPYGVSNYFTLKPPGSKNPVRTDIQNFPYSSIARKFYIPLNPSGTNFGFSKSLRYCQASGFFHLPAGQIIPGNLTTTSYFPRLNIASKSKSFYGEKETLLFEREEKMCKAMGWNPKVNDLFNEPYNLNIYNSKICFNLRYTYPFKYTIFETFLPFLNFSEKIWCQTKNPAGENLASSAKNFPQALACKTFGHRLSAEYFNKYGDASVFKNPAGVDIWSFNKLGSFTCSPVGKHNRVFSILKRDCLEAHIHKAPPNISGTYSGVRGLQASLGEAIGILSTPRDPRSIHAGDYKHLHMKRWGYTQTNETTNQIPSCDVLNLAMVNYPNLDFIQYNESFKIYTNLAYTCLQTDESRLPKYYNFNRQNQKKPATARRLIQGGNDNCTKASFKLFEPSIFDAPKNNSLIRFCENFYKNKPLFDKLSIISHFKPIDVMQFKLLTSKQTIIRKSLGGLRMSTTNQNSNLVHQNIHRGGLPSILNSLYKWPIMNNPATARRLIRGDFNDAFIIIPCTWALNFQRSNQKLYALYSIINWFYFFLPPLQSSFFINPQEVIQNHTETDDALFLNSFSKENETGGYGAPLKNTLHWSKTISIHNKSTWLHSKKEKNTKPYKGAINSKNYNVNTSNEKTSYRPPPFLVSNSKLNGSLKKLPIGHRLAVNFENIYYKNFLWNSRKITLRIFNNAILPLVANRKYSTINFVPKKNYPANRFININLPITVFLSPKFSVWSHKNSALMNFTNNSLYQSWISNWFSEISPRGYQKLPFYSVRHKTLETFRRDGADFMHFKSYPAFINENQTQKIFRQRNAGFPVSQEPHRSQVFSPEGFLPKLNKGLEYSYPKGYSSSVYGFTPSEAIYRSPSVGRDQKNEWQRQPFDHVFSETFSSLRSKWRPVFNGSFKNPASGENDLSFISPFIHFGTKSQKQSGNNENYLLSYHQITPEKLASFRINKWIQKLTQASPVVEKKSMPWACLQPQETQGEKSSNSSSVDRLKGPQASLSEAMGMYPNNFSFTSNPTHLDETFESPWNNNLWSSSFFCKYSLYAISTKSDLFLQNLISFSSLANLTKNPSVSSQVSSISSKSRERIQISSLTNLGATKYEKPWSRNGDFTETQQENTEANNDWTRSTNPIPKTPQGQDTPFFFKKRQSSYEQNDGFANSFRNIKLSIKSYKKTIQRIIRSQDYKLINYLVPSYDFNWQKAIQFIIIRNLKRAKIPDGTQNSIIVLKNKYAVIRLKKYERNFGNPLRRRINQKSLSIYNITSPINLYQKPATLPMKARPPISLKGGYFAPLSIRRLIRGDILKAVACKFKNYQRVPSRYRGIKAWKSTIWTTEANIYFCFHYPIFIQNSNLPWQKSKLIGPCGGLPKHWLNRITIDLKPAEPEFKGISHTDLSQSITIDKELNNSLFIIYTQLSSSSNKTHQHLSYNKIFQNLTSVLDMQLQNKGSLRYKKVGYFTINEGLNSIYKVNYIVESHVSESKPISELEDYSNRYNQPLLFENQPKDASVFKNSPMQGFSTQKLINFEANRSVETGHSLHTNTIKRFENVEGNSAMTDSLLVSNFLNGTYSFIPSKTIMLNLFNELINFPMNNFQVQNENEEYIQIDIWTNGELTPRQALLNAFKKLFELFYNLSKYNCLKPIEI